MRIRVAVAVACLSVAAISVANDVEASIRRSTNIAEQPLDAALQMLAKERDLQMIYPYEIVGERHTRGARGDLTLDEAMASLLVGTGLTYRFLDEKTVTIVPVATAPATKGAPSAATRGGKATQAPSDEPRSFDGADVADEQRSFWQRLRFAQADATSDTTSSSTPDTSDVKLEEIIVTAQKRQERLQDVPISITALSGEELDRSTLTGVHEILSRVPGMALARDATTNGIQLTLRGVTASDGKFSGASPIAYYLDSIPFGFIRSAYVPDTDAYDLDRIEVLRGPQGTLYGAGGVNGVVRVLTHDADLDQYEFKARTAFSSTTDGGQGYRGDAVLNIPIVEGKLAVRAVAGYQKIPGWIDRATYRASSFPTTGLDGPVTMKDANEGDQRNLRLKIDAQPTERLSIGLSAWSSLTRYDAIQIGDNRNRTPAAQPEPSRDDLNAYSLKVDYDFAAFSLSSMSSYLDYTASSLFAAFQDWAETGLRFDNYMWSKVFSQEIILNSRQEGPWRWSSGVFYRDAKDTTDQYFGPSIAIPRIAYWSDFSEQTAVFGEVGRRFWNDRWEWTLGLRYFHDEAGIQSNANVPGQANIPRTGDTFHALTPRAVLTWHPSANLMLYGSYGQGFRSGAQQTPLALNNAAQFPAVKSDKLHNYEIGAKGDFWSGRLSFDTALYYIDWQDTQQALGVVDPDTGLAAYVLTNASSASGLGVDVALTVRPLQGLELGASFSTNDLTFDEDIFSFGGLLFSKGDRLASSPKYTANPFVAYSFPLGGSGYRGRFSADATYTSPLNTKRLGDPNGVDGEAITLVRAGFSIQAPQNWNVGLHVDNLNNYSKSASPFFSNDMFNFVSYRERPRTVSLQFEYQFGRE